MTNRFELLQLEFLASDRWIVVGLLIVFGAVVGSFLNVVVYRLPLGMSLVRPPSRCGSCLRPIRWRDNLPIVGWLILGGRCRDCSASISVRYPVVELLTALASVGVGWSLAMPELAPADTEQVAAFGFQPVTYAFYFLPVCMLLCMALWEYDGIPVQRSVLCGTLAIGLTACALTAMFAPPTANRSDSLLGVGVGAILAALAWPAWVRSGAASDISAALSNALALITVGAFVGPLAAAVIAAAAFVVSLVFRVASAAARYAKRLGWMAALLASTLLWLLGSAELVPFSDVGVAEQLPVICLSGLLVGSIGLVWRISQRVPT